ncbi:LamG domain-containing protein [Aeoliella sp.]|uniref:LamG domain-containing protein n=1 Tax=Aeoliella sp. TaxID=2795800 RepID=UPI003CCBE9EE
MSKPVKNEELQRLLALGIEGELQPAQRARLADILGAEEDAQDAAIAYLMNDSLLRSTLADVDETDPQSLLACLRDPGVADSSRVAVGAPKEQEQSSSRVQALREKASDWNFRRLWPAATLATMVALVVSNVILLGKLRESHAPIAEAQYAKSVARLSESTHCLWDGDIPAIAGDRQQLKLNRSLRLLEGIAEVELNYLSAGDASVHVEGPAGWMITDAGHPSLSYGKMTVNSSSGRHVRSIDTPMGRVSFEGYTSLGVLCFGSELEIHTFSGVATLDSLWFENNPYAFGCYGEDATQRIETGRMLRISIKDNAPAKVTCGAADSSRFASMLSMAADSIHFDEKYERAIRLDKPLAYWRFDHINDKAIPNEMGSEFGASIVGEIETQGDRYNRYLVFGDSLDPEHVNAAIVTDTSFGDILTRNCSLEVWVKPSHFQHTSIVGLVKGPYDDDQRARHGLLVELTGPRAVAVTAAYPGRVRFLNRFPADYSANRVGESSFSSHAYSLRRWQHVVAVKDENERRLYVNGQLESRQLDPNPIDDDLTLIIGRLHRDRPERTFAGQLDELAVYDYPLSESQIRRHHELVRSVPSMQKGI